VFSCDTLVGLSLFLIVEPHYFTMPPNLSWGDSRPYAVLQRTLDKDCRQAEEPKQLVDKASWFHLGHQRQHSAVICSDALLFSSRVLRPSLVTLCSHKSGRCAVELYHTPHIVHDLHTRRRRLYHVCPKMRLV